MSDKDNRRQLATAWMRDRLIEEFRKRPERSSHDVMIEVIIDKIYEQAADKEEANFYRVASNPNTLFFPAMFCYAKVERRKFTVDNLKDKEIK
jgi:hypothetical protein